MELVKIVNLFFFFSTFESILFFPLQIGYISGGITREGD